MTRFLSSISTKIFIGYAAVLLITTATAITISNTNRELKQEVSSFVEKTLPLLSQLQTLALTVKEQEVAAYSLYGITTNSATFSKSRNQGMAVVEKSLSILRAGKLPIESVEKRLKKFDDDLLGVNNVMSAESVDWDLARQKLAKLSVQVKQVNLELQQLTADVKSRTQASTNVMIDKLSDAVVMISFLIGVIIIVFIIAYMFVRRQVVHPIQELSKTLEHVAETRDLTIQVTRNSNDEVGQSATSINGLIASFHGGLSEVQKSIDGISQSVTTLGKTSLDSSQAVNNLKQTISNLVAMMDHLKMDIQGGAERSVVAADIAARGASEVEAGERQVTITSDSIDKLASDLETTANMLLALRSSGSQVSSVVGTIADIADQTNLLALNAAIEAARAGESGRGFAVVADEVRTLATRTHQATVEINSILETIVSSITKSVETMSTNQKQAQSSVELAQSTVDSLAEIRKTILELSGECKQVAAMSTTSLSEVSAAAAEVTNFQTIGDAVSSNSDKVEAAAQSLTQLAGNLDQEVGRFKL